MPYDVTPGVHPGKNLKEPWVEYLDGDYRLVKPVDPTPDGGRMISGARDGRSVHADHVPTRIALRDAHPDRLLLDFELSAIGLKISTAAKDLIERLEPGVHQFFPVEVFAYSYDPATWQDVYGNYDPVPAGTHVDRKIADQWFFVICNRLDTMNRDLTVGIMDNGIYAPHFLKQGRGGKLLVDQERLVLNSSAIGKAHVWCERCVPGIFFSDELIAQIDSAALTGLRRTFVEAM
jgi:hypothetical protein